MDLLKEKYLDLLNENKLLLKYTNYMTIDGENNPIFNRLTQLPKLLKYLDLYELKLFNNRLRTLKNCPKTHTLRLLHLPSLKSLEGMQTDGVILYNLPKLKNLKGINARRIYFAEGRLAVRLDSFEGLPEELHTLELGSYHQSAVFLNSIIDKKYTPKKIKRLDLSYFFGDEIDALDRQIKLIPDIDSMIEHIHFARLRI